MLTTFDMLSQSIANWMYKTYFFMLWINFMEIYQYRYVICSENMKIYLNYEQYISEGELEETKCYNNMQYSKLRKE